MERLRDADEGLRNSCSERKLRLVSGFTYNLFLNFLPDTCGPSERAADKRLEMAL